LNPPALAEFLRLHVMAGACVANKTHKIPCMNVLAYAEMAAEFHSMKAKVRRRKRMNQRLIHPSSFILPFQNPPLDLGNLLTSM
jgi:hypothetical protein